MAIPQHELKEMNRLLENGTNISDIWSKYSGKYGYWEIYWSVSDYSLLGKKRIITNRINSARSATSKKERDKFLNEVDTLITEIYNLAKKNGKKLVDIGKAIER
ncbi:hypothetical protein [Hydrogenophaga sp. SL48]|uniref:hypothetical protein n=1 Tax=Hydrogenophaga sp. SL48 TaxID=2806347 RepID=UPI001F251538|nr:hypothetical protein [Hydrogenophaga sp. SL48]UJW82552.1 hypothetical protein IM738_07670 [Hydrogenophaga sp. SL48]